MRPLIAIASVPFKHCYSEIELKAMEREELEYFWLLAHLTEKIISGVRAAGGVPALLSASDGEAEISSLLERFDAFLFSGGSDITPSFYGEGDCGSVAPDAERDAFELPLCRAVLAADKPVLGICRGCQMLNAAAGGTLIQHLPDVDEKFALHRRPDVMKGYVHDVRLLRPELFAGRSGVMSVNSMHHQAVGRLGEGVEAAAEAEGGVVEAIFFPSKKFALGVQWHPECLAGCDPAQRAIFAALVAHARK
ncbi:gamma-glutamyl-gamma-aminobutyrate hydrolase family protein [Synergistes jonesii]|uniref:gamma-glutamyl-gamma-aminobutyrate hydrolase family protein n=1 Tax=Synergistes jonesii TaxID=2754 RepID=UPI00248F3565|nr:gamma-glutamyl-gamma-aminobutyrate hydrolase family protein [Synergistes jonesii]